MQKMAKLAKECNRLANQGKRVPQLKVKVKDLKHSIALQHSDHLAEEKRLHASHKLKVE